MPPNIHFLGGICILWPILKALSFHITILGSSGAFPAYGRHTSAQLVEIQNRYILVDCGEAVQMQLMKHEVGFHKIHYIFISHLHGDHYLGLMGLIFSMHLHKRVTDLHIFGHQGLDEIITTQLKYAESTPSFKIVFHLLNEDERKIVLDEKSFTVETIPLKHKIRCSGFLFREKPKPRRIDKSTLPNDLRIQQIAALKRGEDILDEEGNMLYSNAALTHPPKRSRSYAYCSDTAYLPTITDQLRGINMLYHEATFLQEDEDKAIATKHTTTKQAATIAQQANVDKLVIGHFSARYRDLSPLLKEAKEIFPDTYLAIEGERFSIPE
jgi:ribonuclease Z